MTIFLAWFLPNCPTSHYIISINDIKVCCLEWRQLRHGILGEKMRYRF